MTDAGDPRDPTPRRRRDAATVSCNFDILFDGKRLFACWANDHSEPNVLRFEGATSYSSGHFLDFYAYNSFREHTINLRHAGKSDICPMNEEDRASLCIGQPMPGDYGAMIELLIAYLKRAGWPLALETLVAPIRSRDRQVRNVSLEAPTSFHVPSQHAPKP